MSGLKRMLQVVQNKIVALGEGIDLSTIFRVKVSDLSIKSSSFPFDYIIVDNLFNNEYYEGLASFFQSRLQEGFSDDGKDGSKFRPFAYKDKVYDGYRYTPRQGDNKYFDIFLTSTFSSFVAKIFNKPVNDMLSISMHYHPKLNNNGWVHSDYASNSFQKATLQKNGLLIGGEQYYDKSMIPQEFIGRRAISFLYYLNNPEYKDGDGGETAIFSSGREDSLCKKIEPLNNRLFAFNISPKSYHAFQKNMKDRCCVVGFLFVDEDEAIKQYGL